MEIQKATFNRKEAAAYLGIAENSLAKLLLGGRIRYIRAGRRILIPKVAIDRFLEDGVSQ
jgi:excisionase family DNA binding protein